MFLESDSFAIGQSQELVVIHDTVHVFHLKVLSIKH
jgi:hypothetical protein